MRGPRPILVEINVGMIVGHLEESFCKVKRHT